MKKLLSKIWFGLKIIGEVLADMPYAEMEYARIKRTCPKCGHVREHLPTGCGPF